MSGRSRRMLGARRCVPSEAGRQPLDASCRQLVTEALRTPSSQNRQPWRLRFTKSGFALYLDATRVAAETDPVARLAHVALGSFLESCALAAPGLGYTTAIELFPEGPDGLADLGRSPVAIVRLQPGSDRSDPLAGFVGLRHTNRRRYRGPVTATQVEALRDDAETLVLVCEKNVLRPMRMMLVEAMRADTASDATHGEKVAMIRANDEEAVETGDGFTYPNLGYTGRTRTFVELMYPLRGGSSRWFRHGTDLIARRVLGSAPAIGLMISSGNTRVDQVEVGEALLRIWLKATSLGLVMHPMCQVLQELPEQAGPQASLRRLLQQIAPAAQLPTVEMEAGFPTVQIVFRLGRAAPTPPSPRRPLDDVVVS